MCSRSGDALLKDSGIHWLAQKGRARILRISLAIPSPKAATLADHLMRR
jgi:hypothetical protein